VQVSQAEPPQYHSTFSRVNQHGHDYRPEVHELLQPILGHNLLAPGLKRFTPQGILRDGSPACSASSLAIARLADKYQESKAAAAGERPCKPNTQWSTELADRVRGTLKSSVPWGAVTADTCLSFGQSPVAYQVTCPSCSSSWQRLM